MTDYIKRYLQIINRHIEDEIYKASNMEHFSKEKITFFHTISKQTKAHTH